MPSQVNVIDASLTSGNYGFFFFIIIIIVVVVVVVVERMLIQSRASAN